MEDFQPEQYPVLTEARFDEGFVPLHLEVHSVATVKHDLLSTEFGTAPRQGALRSHSSEHALAEEEARRSQEEASMRNKVILQQEELDAMLEEAKQQGKEEALLENVEAQHAKLEASERKLHAVLADLAQQQAHSLVELEQSALNFTLQLAKKIIDQAVEINPEYIISVIREALNLSGGAQVRKVRVSPQDMEFIEVLKVAEGMKEFDGTWIFEADETVKAGCILEGSAGIVDFQLDKAWERVKEKIVSAARHP